METTITLHQSCYSDDYVVDYNMVLRSDENIRFEIRNPGENPREVTFSELPKAAQRAYRRLREANLPAR